MKLIDNQANIQAIRKISSQFKTVSMEIDELLSMVINTAAEDRKSTRLNSSHTDISRMPSSA